jgi:hypothetical protein
MSVPSFSSFHPSPPTKNKTEEKSHKDKKGKRKNSSRFEREVYVSGSESAGKQKDIKHRDFLTQVSIPSLSSPCVTDLKGDPLNLQYGALHSCDIPRYRRSGCKCASCAFERSSYAFKPVALLDLVRS